MDRIKGSTVVCQTYCKREIPIGIKCFDYYPHGGDVISFKEGVASYDGRATEIAKKELWQKFANGDNSRNLDE